MEDFVSIPGMVFIDSPALDYLTKVRSRGVSMCDMAIVVIDVMKELENQTVESIQLLKECRKLKGDLHIESINHLPNQILKINL